MRATERAGRRHGTRGAVAAVLVAAVGLLCVVLLLPLTASTTDSAREITLVTRNMAFYLEGGTEPNPTIRVRAGEEVRFTVLNRDPGFVHNFVVDAWDLETPFIETEASTTIVVRAPTRPGQREYVCAPHGKMMRGVIEVVGGD
jgi:plastocyanin